MTHVYECVGLRTRNDHPREKFNDSPTRKVWASSARGLIVDATRGADVTVQHQCLHH